MSTPGVLDGILKAQSDRNLHSLLMPSGSCATTSTQELGMDLGVRIPTLDR